MINGIMTLSGAWEKLREDPILKFLVVSLSFYGMSTFEGPMMAIKTVNALSHYTDWTVGHVHSGALGWVALVSIGSLYALIPWIFGKKSMYSVCSTRYAWPEVSCSSAACSSWPTTCSRPLPAHRPAMKSKSPSRLDGGIDHES